MKISEISEFFWKFVQMLPIDILTKFERMTFWLIQNIIRQFYLITNYIWISVIEWGFKYIYLSIIKIYIQNYTYIFLIFILIKIQHTLSRQIIFLFSIRIMWKLWRSCRRFFCIYIFNCKTSGRSKCYRFTPGLFLRTCYP